MASKRKKSQVVKSQPKIPECPVCKQPYQPPNMPKIMTTCGHTLCLNCLQNLERDDADSRGVVKCPECGEQSELGPDGIQGFYNNLEIMRAVEQSQPAILEEPAAGKGQASRSSQNKEMSSKNAKKKEVFEACYEGNTTLVRSLLLSRAVRVNAKYKKQKHGKTICGETWPNGTTCLMFAAFQGNAETIKMLIREFKADVNQKNELGQTAVHLAAFKGHRDAVHILCEDGKANLEEKSSKGWIADGTALMYAAKEDRGDVVEYLLSRGANVNQKSFYGSTALELACGENVKQLLRQNGGTMELLVTSKNKTRSKSKSPTKK